ncbi:MAG: FAD-binding oxidoreductase [Xanthobacteraceae bacterium]
MGAFETRTLRSFDGGAIGSCRVYRPDRYAVFQQKSAASEPIIARGSGLSYAAAAFVNGGTTVDMRQFDRILSYDDDAGRVEVEAGITLCALYNFLIARNRYLAVQPGHGSISVGGCIAVDAHGKNPAKDGTFSTQVLSLRLYHPTHGLIEISREKMSDVFDATCGGYGLTGAIVSARLATARVPADALLVRALPVDDPAQGALVLREENAKSDLTYSWHDFFSKTGKGFVFTGSFCQAGTKQTSGRHSRLSAERRAWLPFGIYGAAAGRIQNRLFYALHRPWSAGRIIELQKAIFPIHGMEAYFFAYGAPGFHEHQAIVPDTAFPAYIAEVRRLAKTHGAVPIVLASGKCFAGDSGLLRFAGTGTCFAVNVPRTRESARLLDDFNRLVVEMKGRPNIIKDSTLRRSTVEACYPEYGKFRDILRQWDPQRLFQSELSQRLEL